MKNSVDLKKRSHGIERQSLPLAGMTQKVISAPTSMLFSHTTKPLGQFNRA